MVTFEPTEIEEVDDLGKVGVIELNAAEKIELFKNNGLWMETVR